MARPVKRLMRSVMCPTLAMHVTVADFLGQGFAHADDFNREMQRLACQGVVEVEIDDAHADFLHGGGAAALIGFHDHPTADFQRPGILQLLARYPLYVVFLAQAIGVFGGDRDFELLAYLSEHFDIGVKKTLGKRLFMFQARNKAPSPLIH